MNNRETLITNDLVDTYLRSHNSRHFCINKGLTRNHFMRSPWLYLLEISKRLGWQINQSNDSERNIDELWMYSTLSTKTLTNDLDLQFLELLEATNKSQAKSNSALMFYVNYFHLNSETKSYYSNFQILTAPEGRLHRSIAASYFYSLYGSLNNCRTVVLDVPSSALLYAITINCKISWYETTNHNVILNDFTMRNYDLLTTLMSFEEAPYP